MFSQPWFAWPRDEERRGVILMGEGREVLGWVDILRRWVIEVAFFVVVVKSFGMWGLLG